MEKYMPRVDRLMHFFVGTLIFIFAQLFVAEWVALITVSVIATGKELYDEFIKKTQFDLVDLLFTILTGLILTIFK